MTIKGYSFKCPFAKKKKPPTNYKVIPLVYEKLVIATPLKLYILETFTYLLSSLKGSFNPFLPKGSEASI